MRLRLPRRRIWRAAIYLVSLLLVLFAADLVLVEMRRTIHPGFDTTRIVGPPQADGAIDYVVALESQYSQGVTPENNAAPLLLRALGRAALPANDPPDGITDRLGMAPLPEQGNYFEIYGDFARKHNAGDDADPSKLINASAWPVKIDPLTAQWVKENEGPLALIVEASRRTRLFIPSYGGRHPRSFIETQAPRVIPVRNAAVALLARSIIRLDAGDAPGFREDVLAVHRLARLVAQGPTIIERLVALLMDNSACNADRLAVTSGKLPPGQVRIFAAELAASSDMPYMDSGLELERFRALDGLQYMARMGPSYVPKLANVSLGRFVPIPYEAAMRTINHYYDGVLSVLRQPVSPQRLAALRLWEEQITEIHKESIVTSLLSQDWLVGILMPKLSGLHERRVDIRLTKLVVALAAFQADHGAFPATLAELSPGYLPAIPNDLFNDKPLIYSRTDTGYMLYSVGPNMTDDGGKSDKQGDDIVMHVP
jgi:hypothetical protein